MPVTLLGKLPLATRVLLLCALGLASGCQQEVDPVLPEVAAEETAAGPVATPSLPEEDFHSTIDCAALLAVHESALNGKLKDGSPAFNLISYGLGKAQEYAQQAGITAAEVKLRYAEKTLEYFRQHEVAPAAFLEETRLRAEECGAALRQYEPDIQIQNALRTAVEQQQKKR